MADERKHDEAQDAQKDLENIEVTELDDKDLEDPAGGNFQPLQGGDFNCSC